MSSPSSPASARRRHARYRFACAHHLEELCACSASEYTYFQRKDAAQLRSAAKGLTSNEEHLAMWTEEARNALAAARGAGGGSASSFRSASAKGVFGGDSAAEEVVVAAAAAAGNVKEELVTEPSSVGPAPDVEMVSPPQQQALTPGSTPPEVAVGGASGEVAKVEPAAAAAGDVRVGASVGSTAAAGASAPAEATISAAAAATKAEDDEMDVSVESDTVPSSLLPPGWHERPSLRYIGDLIRVGEELGAAEPILADLRQVVDACAGWVKTIEVLLGPCASDPSAATTAAAAISFGTTKRATSMSSAAAAAAAIVGATAAAAGEAGASTGRRGRGGRGGGRGGGEGGDLGMEA